MKSIMLATIFSRENENEKLSRSKRLKWKNDREKWEKNKRKFVY